MPVLERPQSGRPFEPWKCPRARKFRKVFQLKVVVRFNTDKRVPHNSAKSQFRKVTIPQRIVSKLYNHFCSRSFSTFGLPGYISFEKDSTDRPRPAFLGALRRLSAEESRTKNFAIKNSFSLSTKSQFEHTPTAWRDRRDSSASKRESCGKRSPKAVRVPLARRPRRRASVRRRGVVG